MNPKLLITEGIIEHH